MPIAVNMRMQWGRMQKYNLRCFHWVMLRKVDLKLISFIYVESSRSSIDFNYPPLEIIGDFVFETGGRVDLPLNKLLLEAIASNLTQSLKKHPNSESSKTKTKKATKIK
jgi:hypothetical protein